MNSRLAAAAVVALALGAVGLTSPAAATTGPVKPMLQFTLGPDMTGDGRGETLAVDATGALFLFPGTADGRLATPILLGGGFGDEQVFAPGDLDSDGRADVLAVTTDGNLWLYHGRGTAPLGDRVPVGSGWTGWRLVPAGDLTGDGQADLLGINSQGNLFLFAGKGNGRFATRVQVGSGWQGWRLQAAGDLNRDGRADIVGINPRGLLYQYLGKGNGRFAARQAAGSGWGDFTLAAGADLSGDGRADLLGCSQASGALYSYRGLGNARFAARALVDANWCARKPVLPLTGRLIVIDPGHNGRYSTAFDTRLVPAGHGQTKACNTAGTAANDGYPEHAYTWAQAQALKTALAAAGATVLLTRYDDASLGPCVDERARIPNDARADLLISIHADGNLTAGARGFHVIHSTWMEGGAGVEAASAQFAARVRDALGQTAMPRSTYIGGGTALSPRADIAGLNLLQTTPGVMIEMGNMRNRSDAALLESAAFRTSAARALTQAVLAYLRAG